MPDIDPPDTITEATTKEPPAKTTAQTPDPPTTPPRDPVAVVPPDAGEGTAPQQAPAGAAPQSPPPPPSDEEFDKRIAEAEEALAEARRAKARHAAEKERKEADAKLLEAYRKDWEAILARRRELERYRSDELTHLEFSEADAQKIGGTVAEVDKAIDALDSTIAEAEAALADSRQALARKKGELRAAQEALDAVRAPKKTAEQRFRDADAVRKEANEARAAGKYELAFYLVDTRLKEVLERQPAIPRPDDLLAAIARKQQAYDAATTAVGKLESEVADAEKKLADDRRKSGELRANRETAIREALAALDENNSTPE